MEASEKIRVIKDAYNDLLVNGRVSSLGEFADLLEINRSTLSSAINGNEKYLTDRLIRRIQKYTNKEITSIQETTITALRIPVIPYAAHGGSLSNFSDSVSEYDCERIVSPIKGATLAMTVTGDSMAPEYPNGSKIFISKVSGAYIDFGRVYVLDTVDGAIIKEVQRTERPDVVRCVSLNPDPKFAPYEIETKYINGWYRVLLVMSLK